MSPSTLTTRIYGPPRRAFTFQATPRFAPQQYKQLFCTPRVRAALDGAAKYDTKHKETTTIITTAYVTTGKTRKTWHPPPKESKERYLPGKGGRFVCIPVLTSMHILLYEEHSLEAPWRRAIVPRTIHPHLQTRAHAHGHRQGQTRAHHERHRGVYHPFHHAGSHLASGERASTRQGRDFDLKSGPRTTTTSAATSDELELDEKPSALLTTTFTAALSSCGTPPHLPSFVPTATGARRSCPPLLRRRLAGCSVGRHAGTRRVAGNPSTGCSARPPG